MFDASKQNEKDLKTQRAYFALFGIMTAMLVLPVLIILTTLIVKGAPVISMDFLFTSPTDGMTADYYDFSHAFLGGTATRIINEVKGINRVVYDITSKPPGTIEWE